MLDAVPIVEEDELWCPICSGPSKVYYKDALLNYGFVQGGEVPSRERGGRPFPRVPPAGTPIKVAVLPIQARDSTIPSYGDR